MLRPSIVESGVYMCLPTIRSRRGSNYVGRERPTLRIVASFHLHQRCAHSRRGFAYDR